MQTMQQQNQTIKRLNGEFLSESIQFYGFNNLNKTMF